MTIKFVTINLLHGGIFLDNILKFLKEQDADIVVMQEAYNGTDAALAPQYRSMEVLSKELGYPYMDFAGAYRDMDRTDGKAPRGNGILSKFPVTDHDVAFFYGQYSDGEYRDIPGQYEHCPRPLQHAVLDTPVGEVNVYNIQGVWDLNGERYSEQRKHMADVVIAETNDKKNVILAGDTNAKPVNQAIKNIEEHLHSVFGDELPSTFNMRHKDNPGYATAAVDMIFVSKSIKVVAKDCPDDDVSDHKPLTAVLEIV